MFTLRSYGKAELALLYPMSFYPGFLAVLCAFIYPFSYDSIGKMLIFAHMNGHSCVPDFVTEKSFT